MLKDTEQLKEWVRITHSISLHLHSTNTDWGLAQQAIANSKVVDPILGINYSPFNLTMRSIIREFGQGSQEHINKTLAFDEEYSAELYSIHEDLVRLSETLDYPVTILLDSERLWLNEVTKDTVDIKHDHLYQLCKSVFPEAIVNYWGQGSVRLDGDSRNWLSDHPGWGTFPKVNPDSLGDKTSVILYRPNQYVREWQAAVLTHETSSKPLIAWVSLGAGWEQSPRRWNDNLDYKINIDYGRGRYINNLRKQHPLKFPPFDSVAFYPNPERTTDFWERLKLYSRGANA